MRIAILDDELSDRQRVEALLSNLPNPDGKKLTLHSFSRGEELLKQLKRETFDLLILDWQLPDLSGLDVLAWTHKHLDDPPPTIMVTNRNAEQDIVQALESGAADYVNKPFRALEFLARIQAVLRRHGWGKDTNDFQQNTFGALVFNDSQQEVTLSGDLVPLTEREYRLAQCLFNNLGRPLSREYLYERFWPYEETFSSRPLDTHIYRLRHKLGLTAERGWRLVTIYGYGYRLEQVSADGEQTEG